MFCIFSIHFVRFQAREPAQTTSQGPNIAPKKFQDDLEFFNFSKMFDPKNRIFRCDFVNFRQFRLHFRIQREILVRMVG